MIISVLATVSMVPYTWKNVEIVGGGFVSGLVYHPGEKDLMYARTDIGGAYRWDRKTGRWIPLVDWITLPDWNLYGVESIGIDPKDPKRLFLALGTYTNSWGGTGAIVRSDDQGRTFRRTDVPIRFGGNEDGRSIGERIAVNPANRNHLLLGTRQAGMWESLDGAATWKPLASFPALQKPTRELWQGMGSVGVGWILFAQGVVYAAVEGGASPIYRSTDGAKTWSPLPGVPVGISHHGVIGNDGTLFATFNNGPGPNGISDGSVARMDPRTLRWSNITPVKPGSEQDGGFGYAGISLDHENRQLVVSTIDMWKSGDDVFRSTDGGKSWNSLKEGAIHDVSTAPYLKWGNPTARFGWWIGDVEIDPFDPRGIDFVTGATIYSSRDGGRNWKPRAEGLEETALIDATVLPSGRLISAMGDIGGFTHLDLTRSPRGGMSSNPIFTTTDSVDFAQAQPNVVVRVGRASREVRRGAISSDGGLTWRPFGTEPEGNADGGCVAVSADARSFVWSPGNQNPAFSQDMGLTWKACAGLPRGSVVRASRSDPREFLGLSRSGELWLSQDAGASYRAVGKLPAGDADLRAHPDGSYWAATGSGLLKMVGPAFTPLPQVGLSSAIAIGFGAPAPGGREPTLFAIGKLDAIAGFFRSSDGGKSWERINDNGSGFGTARLIVGDPSRFGRVYLGTNGRGLLYGDPVRR